MKDNSISVDWDRYDTSIVAKYLDTVTVKTHKKFYMTTLPSDMIFIKVDASTNEQQVERLNREFNIHYIDFIGSLIYLLSTRVDFSFAVHKLATFSSSTGKVQFEGLIYILRYIRENETFGLNYYDDMKHEPLSDLLRQASINTENPLMYLYDYSWKDFPETGRSTEAYIIFYQGGPIDHDTHVPGPVYQ